MIFSSEVMVLGWQVPVQSQRRRMPDTEVVEKKKKATHMVNNIIGA
jgi:hypothetical protein